LVQIVGGNDVRYGLPKEGGRISTAILKGSAEAEHVHHATPRAAASHSLTL